jgi:hypothetical protein
MGSLIGRVELDDIMVVQRQLRVQQRFARR